MYIASSIKIGEQVLITTRVQLKSYDLGILEK